MPSFSLVHLFSVHLSNTSLAHTRLLPRSVVSFRTRSRSPRAYMTHSSPRSWKPGSRVFDRKRVSACQSTLCGVVSNACLYPGTACLACRCRTSRVRPPLSFSSSLSVSTRISFSNTSAHNMWLANLPLLPISQNLSTSSSPYPRLRSFAQSSLLSIIGNRACGGGLAMRFFQSSSQFLVVISFVRLR
jgi:hypothetical protein